MKQNNKRGTAQPRELAPPLAATPGSAPAANLLSECTSPCHHSGLQMLRAALAIKAFVHRNPLLWLSFPKLPFPTLTPISLRTVRDVANSHACWSHVCVILFYLTLGATSDERTWIYSTCMVSAEHIRRTLCKQKRWAPFISWITRCLKGLNLLCRVLNCPLFHGMLKLLQCWKTKQELLRET